ncbi:MAG: serine/threonine protein kinase, partial [Lentisphaeraceae bacterium]|nr:serine/threonine protein kinase [Lentisphaeraceae bacterium]
MNDISAIPLMNLGFEESSTEERYQILDLICEGGMGRIYKSYDSQTDRYVAYKSVKDGASYQFELRFRYEAEVTARLEHPNIMPVYDIGVDSQGKPFYTMKLLSGKTLEKVIQEGREQKELIEYLIKVCHALGFSHQRNIIHRDLKPENIIIGDFGEVLLLDWGIAKVLDSKDQYLENEELINLSSDLTQCGTVMGTPVYMAPEQANDAESADKRSDIYSIGAILFKLLTRNDPFSGSTSEEILSKVKTGKVEPFKENIPVSALAVCKKAMSINPEERYQSIEELVSELKKIQGGFTVSAENAGLGKILLSTIKRHKAVSGLSLLFVLILGGVVSYNVSRINEEKVIAQYNFQKAQDALNDLKKASPVYLDRAKHSIAIGKFDDAFVDIKTYLTLNNGSKEAYFLLGRINQGKMKFEEAAKAFEKADGWELDHTILHCPTSMEISKNAWSVCQPDGRIAPDDK